MHSYVPRAFRELTVQDLTSAVATCRNYLKQHTNAVMSKADMLTGLHEFWMPELNEPYCEWDAWSLQAYESVFFRTCAPMDEAEAMCELVRQTAPRPLIAAEWPNAKLSTGWRNTWFNGSDGDKLKISLAVVDAPRWADAIRCFARKLSITDRLDSRGKDHVTFTGESDAQLKWSARSPSLSPYLVRVTKDAGDEDRLLDIFLSTARELVEVLGKPFIWVSFEVMPPWDADKCAARCVELGGKWSCRFTSEYQNSSIPFEYRSEGSNVRLFPVIRYLNGLWPSSVLELQVTICHTSKGPSLLLHTDRDDAFLDDLVDRLIN